MPLVSVIIPSYNRPEFLEKISIPSIIKQTYKNWELIVVDDGSTEDIKSVVERFQKDHPDKSISYIRQENKGPGASRNTGIRVAQGDWIILLDSDDALLPQMMDTAIQATEKGNELVFTNRWNYFMDSKKFEKVDPPNTSAILFKKDLFSRLGFFDESRDMFVEDTELFYRWNIYERPHLKYVFLSEPLIMYAKHSNQLTEFKNIGELKRKIENFLGRGGKLPVPFMAAKYREWGNFYMMSGWGDEARSFYRESLGLQKNLTTKVLFTLSFFGKYVFSFMYRLLRLVRAQTYKMELRSAASRFPGLYKEAKIFLATL